MKKTAINAALEAGKAIMEVYGMEERGIELKADDSPLTLADKRAHAIILEHLTQTGLPVLSEEGKHLPYQERKHWKSFWLVDPLDGTKEFIKRNGEFTVNIALINGQDPVFGVIYVPVTDVLYVGVVGEGGIAGFVPREGAQADATPTGPETEANHVPLARKILNASEQHFSEDPGNWPGKNLPNTGTNSYGIVASRSHPSKETQAFIDEIKKTKQDVRIISKGSSLKICMVAEGQADIYPRFGPTYEWDTAAGHAIAVASGARVMKVDVGGDTSKANTIKMGNETLRYNKEHLLNPWFIVKC